MKNILIIYFIYLFSVINASSQKISVSPQLDVRQDNSFNLIGQVSDKILAFREKNNKFILNIFDKNLNRVTERKIKFEKKNIKIIAVSRGDLDWVIVYSYSHKRKKMIKALKFDAFGNKIDSLNISTQKHYFDSKDYAFVESEDENKLLIFKRKNSSTMDFILIDLQTFTSPYSTRVQFDDINLNFDFRKILLSNEGDFYILLEKSSFIFSTSKHKIILKGIYPKTNEVKNVSKSLNFKLSKIEAKYDNKNNIINIAGSVTKYNCDKTKGYALFKYTKDIILQQMINNDYSNHLLSDYYKLKNKKRKKYIKGMLIKDIILRNDGGATLVFEKKDILKTHNDTGMQRRYQHFRDNIDYIFDDIILISLHNDGEEFWHKIIPKKQASYNDFGIYSSFFTFKLPSELRVLFNDEIKNENQIMMYTINPLGKINRTSLFATELFNLNLAFSKSIQISNTRIIVPSYKKDKLKLVMIRF